MFTFLDLLVVVVMALAAVSLLAVALMFLLRNRTARRVCFWIVAALAVYLGYVGFRINWPGFGFQFVLAALLALAAVGAVVLERLRKDDSAAFLAARIVASVALAAGMLNAFVF